MNKLILALTLAIVLVSSTSVTKAESEVILPVLFHSEYRGMHRYSFNYVGNPDAQIIHFNYDYDGEAADFNGYEVNPNNKQFNFWFMESGVMVIKVTENGQSFNVS